MNTNPSTQKNDLGYKKQNTDILIVGAGPAGLSLALHLIQISKEWASRILIIEKKKHPRRKLCGGALSVPALEILENLSLDPPEDIFAVDEIRIRFQKHSYSLKGNPVLKIVNRASFDHFLSETLKSKGVRILEEVSFESANAQNDGYLVETNIGTIYCRSLVGADGSSSIVRKSLGLKRNNKVS
ncbi:FAD-dependent monooxygenase, partial [Leptospira sp. 96542]|nr:FAD-dependent monooxygenase [Leptospira sp. 96542]